VDKPSHSVEFKSLVIYENLNVSVHQLKLNSIRTNCYLLQRHKDVIIIDPSDKAEEIINYIKRNGLQLRFMLATHGHFDHISAANNIIKAGLVKTLHIHEQDFFEVKMARTQMMMILKEKMLQPNVSMFTIELLNLLNSWGITLKHVGGHSKGSCVLYDQSFAFIFAGDMILNHQLKINILDKNENYIKLKDFKAWSNIFSSDALIFPGHGDITDFRAERLNNTKWKLIDDL
jgi:hydroxyacylglutathione hydrolase